jgi:hypothetical protein
VLEQSIDAGLFEKMSWFEALSEDLVRSARLCSPFVLRVAQAVERCGDGLLRHDPLPFQSPTYTLSLVWRAAVDRDAAEGWFRSLVVDAVRAYIPAASNDPISPA